MPVPNTDKVRWGLLTNLSALAANYSVFLWAYHLILCIKYRHKVIDVRAGVAIKRIAESVARSLGVGSCYNSGQDDKLEIETEREKSTTPVKVM